jgi:hypothetical protein
MSRRKGKGAPRSRAPKVQSQKRPAPTQPRKPGDYVPTDVTPEELFRAIGRLRREARDEIDKLIRFLDDSDNHMELDEAVDDVPCDDSELEAGDGDDEPSLGSHVLPSGAVSYSMPVGRGGEFDCEGDDTPSGRSAEDEPSLGSVEALVRGGQENWAQGLAADQEGDAHEDDEEGHDREDDPADGPLQVNEDGDGDPDDEPLLGWTEQIAQGQGTWGSTGIEAEQGSAAAVDVIRARARQGQSDRHYNNRDGMHVDAEQGFGDFKRLRNLSDHQKKIVEPRLDRDAVHLT